MKYISYSRNHWRNIGHIGWFLRRGNIQNRSEDIVNLVGIRHSLAWLGSRRDIGWPRSCNIWSCRWCRGESWISRRFSSRVGRRGDRGWWMSRGKNRLNIVGRGWRIGRGHSRPWRLGREDRIMCLQHPGSNLIYNQYRW